MCRRGVWGILFQDFEFRASVFLLVSGIGKFGVWGLYSGWMVGLGFKMLAIEWSPPSGT